MIFSVFSNKKTDKPPISKPPSSKELQEQAAVRSAIISEKLTELEASIKQSRTELKQIKRPNQEYIDWLKTEDAHDQVMRFGVVSFENSTDDLLAWRRKLLQGRIQEVRKTIEALQKEKMTLSEKRNGLSYR